MTTPTPPAQDGEREREVELARLPERLRLFIQVNGDGCWEWTGSLNKGGYGTVYYDGGRWLSHRLSWTLLRAAIEPNLTIDHQCKNRRCVNPAHLKPMTLRENVLLSDGFGAMNRRKGFCSKGHPLTGHNVKITERKDGPRRRCRKCLSQGESAKRIRRIGFELENKRLLLQIDAQSAELAALRAQVEGLRKFELAGFFYGGKVVDDKYEPVQLTEGTNLYITRWTLEDISAAKDRAREVFGSVHFIDDDAALAPPQPVAKETKP